MNYNFSLNDVFHCAEQKCQIPGWKAFAWEKAGTDSIVTGSVPTGIYRSGPRKGKPKFTGPNSKIAVTRVELEATAVAYESSTGKCWDCHGTGQEWDGWSKADGTRYRRCSRCGGTGIAV